MLKWLLKVKIEGGEGLLHLVLPLVLNNLNYLTCDKILNIILKAAVEVEPVLHLVLFALNYPMCEEILSMLLKAEVEGGTLLHIVVLP